MRNCPEIGRCENAWNYGFCYEETCHLGCPGYKPKKK